MSLAALFPAAVLETILIRLAPLFLTGAGGDTAAARQAAAQTLGSYHPETEDELRLAANIIAFGLHALEALGQAAALDMPVTRVLRLRGNAVSLSREATKAQRSLDQIQKARRLNKPAAPVEAQPAASDRKAPTDPDPIKNTGDIVIAAKPVHPTRTETEEDRQRDKRIAAFMQRPDIQAHIQAKAAMQSAISGLNDRTVSRAV